MATVSKRPPGGQSGDGAGLVSRRRALDHEFPLLFIYDPATKPSPWRTTLIRYCNVRHHQDELEKERVNRWIDVPLLVPAMTEKGTLPNEKWGVLTVDQGHESDEMDARDAVDVALFASIAALYIGAMLQRLNQEAGQHLQIFRQYTRWLVDGLRLGHCEFILPRIMPLMLRLCRDITGADVAYFRELQGTSLVLSGSPEWSREKPPSGVRIPAMLKIGDDFSATLLTRIEPGGKWNPRYSVEPVVLDDPGENENPDDLSKTKWSAEERELLNFKSALYVPLVVQGQLLGVIVAIAKRQHAFSADISLPVKRLMGSAELWIELAEFHAGRLWLDRVLSETLIVLRQLNSAPDSLGEERFFAGLAAILSAGDGLRWHRVMVFSTLDQAQSCAALTYAVGGLGEPSHLKRQKAVTEQFGGKLQDLVDVRLRDPVPHGDDGAGTNSVDPLYKTCVQVPREIGLPIGVPYGPSAPREIISGHTGEKKVSDAHPLRWMLEEDPSRNPDFSIPVALDNEGWMHDMNKRYPGMFLPGVTFAFPLWGTFGRERRPLGIVLVDSGYSAGSPSPETIVATNAILERAQQILVSRYQERFLRTLLQVLPDVSALASALNNCSAASKAVLQTLHTVSEVTLEGGLKAQTQNLARSLQTLQMNLNVNTGALNTIREPVRGFELRCNFQNSSMDVVQPDLIRRESLGNPVFLLERLSRWKEEIREHGIALVLAASETEFHDLEQRMQLQRYLLAISRDLVCSDNEVHAPVLWAALRRYASLIPESEAINLREFLEAESLLTRQTALQCIQTVFTHHPPRDPTALHDLLQKVSQIATGCITNQTPKPGQEGALALSALLAVAVLGGDNLPVLADNIKKSKANWLIDLARRQLQNLLDRWTVTEAKVNPDDSTVQTLSKSLSILNSSLSGTVT